MVSPVEIRYHPLEGSSVEVTPVIPVEIELDLLLSRSMEENSLHLFGKLTIWRVYIDLIVLGQGVEHLLKVQGMPIGPRCNRALPQGKIRVGDDQVGVKIHLCSKPATLLARPKGTVE